MGWWSYFVAQVWPNLLAQILWTIPAFVVYMWHQRRVIDRIHDETKARVRAETVNFFKRLNEEVTRPRKD